jgi:hypothetical protein
MDGSVPARRCHSLDRLTEGKVRQALALGARQVSARDMPALMRARQEAAARVLTADQADYAAGQGLAGRRRAEGAAVPRRPRALAPDRAELWDARERQVRQGPVPVQTRGCETPECGKPGRPYPVGIRCDDHKPRASWQLSEAQAPAGPTGKCPGCVAADLTYGRAGLPGPRRGSGDPRARARCRGGLMDAPYERYPACCPQCDYPEPADLGPIGPPSHPVVHRLRCPVCSRMFPAFPPGFLLQLRDALPEVRAALADARYLAGEAAAEREDADGAWEAGAAEEAGP